MDRETGPRKRAGRNPCPSLFTQKPPAW